MYRYIILTAVAAAAAAPQENSITYIKMLPQTDSDPAPSYRSSNVDNLPLTIGNLEDKLEDILDTVDTSDNSDDSRSVRSEQTTEEDSTIEDSTQTTEASTEKYEPKTTPLIRKAPKFYSKLSYFEKPNYNFVSTNAVERAGKRKFRSRCRCEKISNCPKLQITVPRCPEEYFLCCF